MQAQQDRWTRVSGGYDTLRFDHGNRVHEIRNHLIGSGARSGIKNPHGTDEPYEFVVEDVRMRPERPISLSTFNNEPGTLWGWNLYSVTAARFKSVQVSGIFGYAAPGSPDQRPLDRTAEGHPGYLRPACGGESAISFERCLFENCGGNLQFATAVGNRRGEGLKPKGNQWRLELEDCHLVNLSRGRARGSSFITAYDMTGFVDIRGCKFLAHELPEDEPAPGLVKITASSGNEQAREVTLEHSTFVQKADRLKAAIIIRDARKVAIERCHIKGDVHLERCGAVTVSNCTGIGRVLIDGSDVGTVSGGHTK